MISIKLWFKSPRLGWDGNHKPLRADFFLIRSSFFFFGIFLSFSFSDSKVPLLPSVVRGYKHWNAWQSYFFNYVIYSTSKQHQCWCFRIGLLGEWVSIRLRRVPHQVNQNQRMETAWTNSAKWELHWETSLIVFWLGTASLKCANIERDTLHGKLLITAAISIPAQGNNGAN